MTLSFDAVLVGRAVQCVYQPIVTVDGGQTVAYEALARGPDATRWANPETLVKHATDSGRLPELDWICRAAACRGALAADLSPRTPLFIHIEPATIHTHCPADLEPHIQAGHNNLQIVSEVTERGPVDNPGGLLATVKQLRGRLSRIALGDAGGGAASLAMMSLLYPDVIKIGHSIIANPNTAWARCVIDAVHAEAVRTGAVILADGIETRRDLAVAKALGATLGQGYLLGAPAPLPRHTHAQATVLPRLTPPAPVAATPFDIVRARGGISRIGRRALVVLNRELEDRCARAPEPTLLLATFQHAARFDAATRRRYAELALHTVLAACFAHDMQAHPAPNVLGCPIPADDPLIDDWTVIALGNRFAEGIFARQTKPDQADTFDVMASNDRDLVLAAAYPLVRRLGSTPE